MISSDLILSHQINVDCMMMRTWQGDFMITLEYDHMTLGTGGSPGVDMGGVGR